MADLVCPNCGHAQPRSNTECPECQIVFSKWRERQRRAAQGPLQPPSPPTQPFAAVSDKVRRVLPKFAALIAVPLGLWLCYKAPAGLPLPPSAHEEPDFHFAIGQPPGWKLSVVKEPRADSVYVLNLVKETAQPLPLELRVLVTPLPISKLRLQVGDRVRFLFNRIFNDPVYGGCPQEGQAAVDVDRLDALKITGRSSVNIIVKRSVWMMPGLNLYSGGSIFRAAPRRLPDSATPPAGAVLAPVEDIVGRPCLYRVYVVPGAMRSYLIGVTGDVEDFPAQAAEVDELVASFRVTQRPWGTEHLLRVFHGEFQQGLVFIILGWMFGFYRWVFKPFLE